MRVLWVQDAFWPDLRGGAERRAFHLVQALAALGHDVDVLARQTLPETPTQQVLGRVHIHRASVDPIDPRLWRVRPWLWMRQWRRIYRDTLNGHTYHAAIVFQPEAAYYLHRARPTLPIIIATGGTWLGAKPFEFDQPDSSLSMRLAGRMAFWQYYAYERLGNRAADYVVAESANVREQLLRLYHLPADHVPVIGNGVAHELFHPRPTERARLRAEFGWPDDAMIAIGVGRLDRVKNFTYLIKAVSAAVRQGVDVHAVLVGEGSQRPTLETMIGDLNLTDRVHLLGHRADVPALLAAADVFVLPSVFESYGNAWPEAMATGLPCMGLRHQFGSVHTATGEHIAHGRTGFILDPQEPADCASRLNQLAASPELRHRMGHAARQVATSRYRWDTTAQCYETLIQNARANHA